MLGRFFRQDAISTPKIIAFLAVSYLFGFVTRLHVILGVFGLNVPNLLQLIVAVAFFHRFGTPLERKISTRAFLTLLGSNIAANLLLFLLFAQSWNYDLGLGPWSMLQAVAVGHLHVFGATSLMSHSSSALGGAGGGGAPFASHVLPWLRSRHLPYLVAVLSGLFFLLSLASGVSIVGIAFISTPVSLIACHALVGRGGDGLPIPAAAAAGMGHHHSNSASLSVNTVLPGSTEEEAKQRRAIAQAALAKHLEQLARGSTTPGVTSTTSSTTNSINNNNNNTNTSNNSGGVGVGGVGLGLGSSSYPPSSTTPPPAPVSTTTPPPAPPISSPSAPSPVGAAQPTE